ncbi:nitrate reductase [NAD(P)H] [Zea mays]|uniref:Nitrate reductase n=1 Tax=Zea mays TaxID=4577 RepID=A0A804NXD0_MAIZE|nr:nitrate reductase [NAD(P)H] [Zea mays]|eukprot:XP_008679268.1 nitrate reductase [NAD(P)H] [Zea mays]
MAASVERHLAPHPWPANAPPKSFDMFRTGSDSDSEDEDSIPAVDWRSLYRPRLEVEPPVHDPRDEATSDAWVRRHPALVRLTGKHPFNSEPPVPRLMAHGFITPAPLHYVRNHGAVPRADWSTWTVEVTGLVTRPAKLTMERLVTEFEAVELPVTLVCAGNRRKEQNMVRQTVGFNWGPGAVSTSVWRGARLRDVLRRCGVMRAADGAANVCFEGAEDLPGGKYGTSLRRGVAMDPARDVILAYMQNGEPLAPDHGFPVRVIVPGFIGGRMVKWLRRVVVASDESDSYYHYRDNRVLPSHVDAELANAEAWWYRPEYIINELNINSVITTPGHDEVLPINALTTQRPYTIKGYAYSGGGRKVTRVEVTLDGGETWQVCSLDHPERPTKYGKYWCWCFWSVDVEVLDVLGAKEIAVRAWDEAMNTQPEKLICNLMGMMNNCWFRVKVNACRPHKGEIGLVFEHPTQPGNQPGGWMARQKHLETSESAQGTLKKSTSTPFMNTATAQYTMSEVRRHKSPDSAWIVVHGHIYDCTGFLKDHPGGADSILISAGTDCTEEFDAIHSDKARGLLETYRVGELVVTGSDYSPQNSHADLRAIDEAPAAAAPLPVSTVALSNPREKVKCRLVGKKSLSYNVRLFRFALPSPDQKLGLPVGRHVYVCASIDGKLCMRAYTPTSPADEVGHVELLIKIYFKDEDPKYPNGGLMSQHLDSLPLGATIDIKGPVGHIEYAGRGGFVVNGERRFARRLAMVAGGTGITPVYQVIQAVLRDQPDDDTEMHLVYANRTVDDMLLREEINRWVAAYPARLKVWYVVSKVARPEDGWEYGVGRVDEQVLREHLPLGDSETLALVCGPPAMIECTVRPGLEKMGYDLDRACLVF